MEEARGKQRREREKKGERGSRGKRRRERESEEGQEREGGKGRWEQGRDPCLRAEIVALSSASHTVRPTCSGIPLPLFIANNYLSTFMMF